MTAAERPTYVPGDLVAIAIRQATVLQVGQSGNWIRVSGEDGAQYEIPLHHQDVTVERVAPAEWPPVLGDLWRDSTGDLWFATLKAARVGDDGRVFESARLVMAPARETPHLYREQRIAPDKLLSQYGPLELVHREPQPADPDGDE
ncbi:MULTISPECIES: hypothetical protein [Micromonospora]|uniref:hypothetical protein n=1 Tax=Micromonospora TaxID=1873 RepID=UPI0004BFC83C|nr:MULTISPECIES: hypothetical protein [Micromonospora]